MVKIKEIRATANYAWSPAEDHPIYIATGTAAQQLDASFSSNSTLELYSLDMSDSGSVAKSAGKVETENRFYKVVWGSAYAEGSNSHIVAGTDKGAIEIYNPTEIINGGDNVLILSTSKHSGPVRALDFNPFQKNLFASGASDSEIFIWDLKNPSSPMTPGAKTQPSSAISSIAWNRQVQHILASTSAVTSGPCCAVWDLRKNEPIIKVEDSSGKMQCSDVAWHPDVATQLVLSSENDQAPVVQLWDLRFAASPMKVLEKHSKGVVSVAWCSRDSDLLLSCGKDNQVYCWNVNAAPPEVTYELETHAQFCFDVQWCPRNPNILSTGSFDGRISIHSLMGGGQVVQSSAADQMQRDAVAEAFGSDAFSVHPMKQAPTTAEKKITTPLKRPPKWMRRPCGVSFAFGGKLVTFDYVPSVEGQNQNSRKLVQINQVVTENDLLVRAKELENALLDNTNCLAYCNSKLMNSQTQFEEDIWNFLKGNFESEPRKEFLQLLGYNSAELKTKFDAMLSKKSINGDLSGEIENLSVEKSESIGNNSFVSSEGSAGGNDADVFDNIASAVTPVQPATTPKPMTIPVKDGDLDSMISQALLVGDYETAVDLCFHGNRVADAIVVAMAGSPLLLEKTQRRYFASSESKITRLLSAVVTKDWKDVVRSCALDNWKEALASLLTYASPADLVTLCDELGGRLEDNEEYKGHACLCYICSGNIEKLVQAWGKVNVSSKDNKNTIQDLIEKMMVLLRVVESRTQGQGAPPIGEVASDKLAEYSSMLAAQGQLSSAMEILPNSSDKLVVQILRDRLFHSQGDSVAGMQAPVFPFPKDGTRINSQRPAAQVQPQRQTPIATQQNNRFMPQQQQFLPNNQQDFQPNYGRQQPPQQQSVARSQQLSNPYSGSSNPYSNSRPFGRQAPTAPQTEVQPNLFTPQSVPRPSPQVQPNRSTYNPQQPQFQPNNTRLPPTSNPNTPPGSTYTGAGEGQNKHQVGGWNDPPMVDPNRIPKKKKNEFMIPGVFPVQAPPPMMSPNMTSSQAPNQQLATTLLDKNQGKIDNVGLFMPEEAKSKENEGFMSRMIGYIKPSHASKTADKTFNGADHIRQSNFAPPSLEQTAQVFQPDSMNLMTPAAPQNPHVQAPPGSMQHPRMVQQPGGYPQQQSVPHSRAAGTGLPPQNIQQQQQAAPAAPTGAVKDVPKAPIPAEYQILQIQFDDLINKCHQQGTTAQIKRKLDDCSRRLEFLYDKLRANSLSPNVIGGLRQVAQATASRDYALGLRHHTNIVSHSNFSEISAFMPGIKSMLQIAHQMRI